MFKQLKKHMWVLAGVTGAAVATIVLSQNTTRAQEAAPAMVLGTFEPAQVAQESGMQAKMQAMMQEKMGGLRERAQAAQQSGDQAAMQQIQAEAQQIQMDAVKEFQDALDATLPKVAEEAGVQIIAVEYAFTAPGIETKDLTAEIVAALGGGTPPVEIVVPDAPQAQ